MKEDVMGKNKSKGTFYKFFGLKRKLISLVLVFLLLFNMSGLGVQASEGTDYPSLEMEETVKEPIEAEGGDTITKVDVPETNDVVDGIAEEENSEWVNAEDEKELDLVKPLVFDEAQEFEVVETVELTETTNEEEFWLYLRNGQEGPHPLISLPANPLGPFAAGDVVNLPEVILPQGHERNVGWTTIPQVNMLSQLDHLLEWLADSGAEFFPNGDFIMPAENVTLYSLRAKVGGFSVRFSHTDNGAFLQGTGTITFDDIRFGTSWEAANIAIPEPVPNEGYYFAGWRLLPDGELSLSLNPPPIIERDLHFEAVFKKSRTITLYSAGGSMEYDGTALIAHRLDKDNPHRGLPEGYVLEIVDNLNFTGSQTVVGSSDNTFTIPAGAVRVIDEEGYDVTYQFRFEEAFGRLVVTSTAEIRITAASDSKVYDGTPLVNDNYTHSDLPDGITLVEVVVEGSQTEVGSSANVVKSFRFMHGEDNVTEYFHNVRLVDGRLKVWSEAEITITAASDSKIFDGTPLVNAGFTYSILPPGVTRVTAVVEGSQTAVGSSANVVVSFRLWNGDDNVTEYFPNVKLVNGTLSIIPIEPPELATRMIIRYNSNHSGKGGADLYFVHPYMLTDGYVVGDSYTVKAYTHATKVASTGWVLPENYADLVFKGWNTRPDGSGTHYNAGELLLVENVAGQSTETVIVSLYAQWESATDEGAPSRRPTREKTRAPKTGDSDTEAGLLFFYLALTLLSLTTIIVWFAYSRMKREMQEANRQSLRQKEFLLTTNEKLQLPKWLFALNPLTKRWGVSARQPSEKP
jgi:hypothetical protein